MVAKPILPSVSVQCQSVLSEHNLVIGYLLAGIHQTSQSCALSLFSKGYEEIFELRTRESVLECHAKVFLSAIEFDMMGSWTAGVVVGFS